MWEKAKELMNVLRELGYKTYIVGGSVRDTLLSIPVKDYDIATDAPVHKGFLLFAEAGYPVSFKNEAYGVLDVDGYEVATFRQEHYTDTNNFTVDFIESLEEDAKRRDFTINAIYADAKGRLIDPQNGRSDIKNRLLRTVGDAEIRFREDPSRILRGIDLACRLDFAFEESTFTGIKNSGKYLKYLQKSVIYTFIRKAVEGFYLSRFMQFVRALDLVPYIFPELAHTVGMPQNPKYHHLDVYDHTVAVVASAEKTKNTVLVYTALFHDCAKGLEGIRELRENGEPTDKGHEEKSAELAGKAVKALVTDRKTRLIILFLITHHGLYLDGTENMSVYARLLRKYRSHFDSKADLHNAVNYLVDFLYCDADGFEPTFGAKKSGNITAIDDKLMIALEHTALYPRCLPIRGSDLVERGFKGSEIGEILSKMVELNLLSYDKAVSYLDKQVEKRAENEVCD